LKEAESNVDNAFIKIFDLRSPAYISYDEVRKHMAKAKGMWTKDTWPDELEETNSHGRTRND
jgi:hypothetical protein